MTLVGKLQLGCINCTARYDNRNIPLANRNISTVYTDAVSLLHQYIHKYIQYRAEVLSHSSCLLGARVSFSFLKWSRAKVLWALWKSFKVSLFQFLIFSPVIMSDDFWMTVGDYGQVGWLFVKRWRKKFLFKSSSVLWSRSGKLQQYPWLSVNHGWGYVIVWGCILVCDVWELVKTDVIMNTEKHRHILIHHPISFKKSL